MKLFDFQIPGNCHGERNQGAYQTSINFLRTGGVRMAPRIEHAHPVDSPSPRNGTESKQIWEERDWSAFVVQHIPVTDLRVSVPIRCVGELERDEGLALWAIKARALLQQGFDKLSADKSGKEFAEYHCLIMPTEFAGGDLEYLRLLRSCAANTIDEGVVRASECQMHLGHEHV